MKPVDRACKVSIVIPHYNGQACLERLLPSLESQTFQDFEVIIIDDCTPDKETVAFIEGITRTKPNVSLVQNEQNMRFIKTCNKGIRLAKGQYICLLNQDVTVERAFVDKNVRILEDDKTIGGLSCVIVDQNGVNWFSGGRYRFGIPTNLTDDFPEVRTVDYVAGTAAFYRRDVFERIGLFDEKYVMYHEDVEFGLRVKQQTDYQMCAFPEKLVTHFLVPSMARSELCYYLNRNLFLLSRQYARRHLPIVLARVLAREVFARLILAPLALLALKPSLAKRWIRFALASARGAVDGLTASMSSHCTVDPFPKDDV